MADLKRLRRDTTSGQSAAHPPSASRAAARGPGGLCLWARGGALVLAAVARLVDAQGPGSADPGRAHHDHTLHDRRRREVLPSSLPRRREGGLRLGRTRRRQLGRLRQGAGPGDEAATHHRGSRPRTGVPRGRPMARRLRLCAWRRTTHRRDLHGPVHWAGRSASSSTSSGPRPPPPAYFYSHAVLGARRRVARLRARRRPTDVPARIVRLSLATLERRPLTSPPPESLGDLEPQISPRWTAPGLRPVGLPGLRQSGRMGAARERRRGPAADLWPVPLCLGPQLDAGRS